MVQPDREAPLEIYYRTATGPRTTRLLVASPRSEWYTDMGTVFVESRDSDTVVLTPRGDGWDEEEEEGEDYAEWRDGPSAFDCFKTSYAYELINQAHPNIVPVLGQDAWTGLPILAKPTGGTLEQFISKNLSRVYSEPLDSARSRIKPDFLPLGYQWCLQLLSALSLIHSRKIVYGELVDYLCWLSSPSLSIALAGFTGSQFRDEDKDWDFPGTFYSGIDFSPEESEGMDDIPTFASDIFTFGRIVYQIMTSQVPGMGQGKEWDEITRMVRERDWPELEERYLGEIVHKCWEYQYANVEELRDEVKAYVQSQGWEVTEENELQNLDLDLIHQRLEEPAT